MRWAARPPPAAVTVIVVPFAVVLPPAFVAVSRVSHEPVPNVLPLMVGFWDVENCVHDPLPAVRYSHDHDVGEPVHVPEEKTKLSAVVPLDGEQDGATELVGGPKFQFVLFPPSVLFAPARAVFPVAVLRLTLT